MTAVGAVYVSVINASYTPLGATKLKRAMALVLRGDAVIEEHDEKRELHHAGGKFPWPLVIRLLRYVKVPISYGDVTWSKSGVLKRDGNICAYNLSHAANTVDHVLPVSRGGQNTWENTVASCYPCNSKKADRTPEEAGMRLQITPYTPQRIYLRAEGKERRKR